MFDDDQNDMNLEKHVEKVLVYITRGVGKDTELLVFKHKDSPEAGTQVPDEWSHEFGGDGEDSKMIFLCYWVPLASARDTLAVGQGIYLDELT